MFTKEDRFGIIQKMDESRDIKQVIVMRKDLNMRRGKEIAQGSHASLSFISRELDAPKTSTNKLCFFSLALTHVEYEWIAGSFKKITLQVDSEKDLMDVASEARKAGLTVHVITDSGKTEFNGVPTKTCLAIGPDYSDKIDPVTKHLKLY